MEKRPCYKSRGRFSIAVRYVLERAKNICVDGINFFIRCEGRILKGLMDIMLDIGKSDLI